MSQFLTDRGEIEEWLNEMLIFNYELTDDLIVNGLGSINIIHRDLTFLPVQFGYIDGNFNCSSNKLASLKGCPHTVKRDFDCSYNRLESLEDGPINVKGSYDCNSNRITTLIGCAQNLEGDFNCSFNSLVDFNHGPQTIGGHFRSLVNNINTLEYLPQIINGHFAFSQDRKFPELSILYNDENYIDLPFSQFKKFLSSLKLHQDLSIKLVGKHESARIKI